MEWMGHVLRLRGEKNSGGGGSPTNIRRRTVGNKDKAWETVLERGSGYFKWCQLLYSVAACILLGSEFSGRQSVMLLVYDFTCDLRDNTPKHCFKADTISSQWNGNCLARSLYTIIIVKIRIEILVCDDFLHLQYLCVPFVCFELVVKVYYSRNKSLPLLINRTWISINFFVFKQNISVRS